MNQRFEIKFKLPSLNDIVALAKIHFGAYSGKKKKIEKDIGSAILAAKIKPMRRVDVNVTFHEPQKSRRDPDNVMAGIKFILDAIRNAGIIEDDSKQFVRRVSMSVIYDMVPKTYFIYVILTEVTK